MVQKTLISAVAVFALAGATWFAFGRPPGQPDGSVPTLPPSVPAAAIEATVKKVTATSATITWTTDQPLTSQVEYGPTTAYGSLSAFNSAAATGHSVVLTGLTPGMTYNFRAMSSGPDGRIRKSPNATLSTLSTSGAPMLDHVAISEVTATSATITWATDQPAASQVEYGPTPAYGYLSAFNSSLATSHSAKVSGLIPATTYAGAALSVNASGQVGTSANFTFTTAGLRGGPEVSAVMVTDITSSSARISWTTDLPSASQVEYGLTVTHGLLSAYTSTAATSHSMNLTGLIPGTLYNFSALSANAAGQVGKSANATFTTVAAPPVIRGVAVTEVTPTSVTLRWTTDQPSTSQVAYGDTTAYGSVSPASSVLVTDHSVTLHGLKSGTVYHSAAMSVNSTGMQNSSPNLKFVTR